MQVFTGWQYLLIDCANHFGLDKLLFEERIEWATKHLSTSGNLWTDSAETKPLYIKAVMAIRKAQARLAYRPPCRYGCMLFRYSDHECIDWLCHWCYQHWFG